MLVVIKKQRSMFSNGKTGEIRQLHTAIKGVWCPTSGANIVSFNLDLALMGKLKAIMPCNKERSLIIPLH